MIHFEDHIAGQGFQGSFVSEGLGLPREGRGSRLLLEPAPLAILDKERPRVEIPKQDIAHISRLENDSDTQAAVEGVAARHFDNEPVRLSQLNLAKSESAGLEAEAVRCQQFADNYHHRGVHSVGETRKSLPMGPLLTLPNAPYLTKLATGWLMLGVGFTAEFYNALTIITMAHELEGASVLAKLAYAAPYILVMFSTVLLLSIVPGPAIRRYVSGWIMAVLGIVSIVGLLCFSMRLGSMVDVDPMNPQFWPSAEWVVFWATLCGGGVSACAKYVITNACESLFETQIQTRGDFTFNVCESEDWGDRARHARALSIRLRTVVTDIETERAKYVQDCLVQVQIARQYLKDMYAAVRLQTLPAVDGFDASVGRSSIYEGSEVLRSSIHHSADQFVHDHQPHTKRANDQRHDDRPESDNGSANNHRF